MKSKTKKNFDRGLVIGKFYPFHRGHHYLIETALKNSNHDTIILCHTQSYSIPPEIRAGWIKEIFPDIDIRILLHDPSMDDNSPKKSEIWAKITLDFLGFSPDAVFSSESYGKPYSKFMGSTHIMVDGSRKKYPVSGTLVRQNPLLMWNYLDPPVKAYFAKRIAIVGAESTGTTTLAQDLAKHYKTVWVPEYGRTYYEGKMFSQSSQKWRSEEFVYIAQNQNELENKLAGISNKLVICDTDSLATVLWHKRYLGFMSINLEPLIQPKDLYILTDIDIPFVQDGTRDGEKIRSWMHQLFIKELTRRKQKYIIISGSKQYRLKKAIDEIEKIL